MNCLKLEKRYDCSALGDRDVPVVREEMRAEVVVVLLVFNVGEPQISCDSSDKFLRCPKDAGCEAHLHARAIHPGIYLHTPMIHCSVSFSHRSK